MKINNSNYEINSDKDNITIKFTTTFFEGRNVKDLQMDLSHAIAFRGQELDRALPPDPYR